MSKDFSVDSDDLVNMEQERSFSRSSDSDECLYGELPPQKKKPEEKKPEEKKPEEKKPEDKNPPVEERKNELPPISLFKSRRAERLLAPPVPKEDRLG